MLRSYHMNLVITSLHHLMVVVSELAMVQVEAVDDNYVEILVVVFHLQQIVMMIVVVAVVM